MLAVTRNRAVPSKYIAASLYHYAKTWAHVPIAVDDDEEEDNMTGDEDDDEKKIIRHRQREVIEVVEKLLPDNRGLLPCRFLFRMLSWAVASHSSDACRRGLELRIGRQLEEAGVEDLLILRRGYNSTAGRDDVECVIRIWKSFYASITVGDDPSVLTAVAELFDGYLAEIGKDASLEKDLFLPLLEMSATVCNEMGRCLDGVYVAIDAYLCAHAELTELEREALCQVLDCNRLTPAACQHAARNERLPLRMSVQLLLVGLLKMRGVIAGAMWPESEGVFDGEEEEVVEEEKEMMGRVDYGGVVDVERECCGVQGEIEKGRREGHFETEKRVKKRSFWKEMRRKVKWMNGLIVCSSKDATCNISHARKIRRKRN